MRTETLRADQSVRIARAGRHFRPHRMPDPYIIHAGTDETEFPRESGADDDVSFAHTDSVRYFNLDLDVIVFMPTAKENLTEPGNIRGGRHVRVIGGYLAAGTVASSVLFWCSGQTGSCFIEGMRLDTEAGDNDALASRWTSLDDFLVTEIGRVEHPGLTIQHCLAENITGTVGGAHGDAYQTQADQISYVRIEEFTFYTAYQGIFLPTNTDRRVATKGVWLRKVNGRWYESGGNRALTLWMYDGTSSITSPVTQIHLAEVWANSDNPSPFDTWGENEFEPNSTKAWGASIETDAIGDYADFGGDIGITGIIRKGVPPGGDFVTADTCGLNYRSPWPVA